MKTEVTDIMNLVEKSLLLNFNRAFAWLEKDAALRNYMPLDGGWSINQVLEHISLTNHFLLRIIQKGTGKAVKRSVKLKTIPVPENYVQRFADMEVIGKHNSFAWMRPEHMVPEGQDIEVVRAKIQEQLKTCIASLAQLKNGEGLLVTTSMSVNSLGKIDVYQYLYFLAKHIERHITQMELIEKEYFK